MEDSWRYTLGQEACPWSESDLSVWHDLLGEHVHPHVDTGAHWGASDQERIDRIKTELARQRMMSKLVSREVYDRSMDEMKKIMAEALRRRDEESARQREILQVIATLCIFSCLI